MMYHMRLFQFFSLLSRMEEHSYKTTKSSSNTRSFISGTDNEKIQGVDPGTSNQKNPADMKAD